MRRRTDTQFAPDRSLVEHLIADDESAFHELLARYRSTVYAIAYAALIDPEQSEAVVSDTFGEARRTAAAFLGTGGSVSAWLVDLAHRSAGTRSAARHLKG